MEGNDSASDERVPGRIGWWYYPLFAASYVAAVAVWATLALASGVLGSGNNASQLLEGIGLLAIISLSFGYLTPRLIPPGGPIVMSREGIDFRVETGNRRPLLVRSGLARRAHWFRPWREVHIYHGLVVFRPKHFSGPWWFAPSEAQLNRLQHRLTNTQR